MLLFCLLVHLVLPRKLLFSLSILSLSVTNLFPTAAVKNFLFVITSFSNLITMYAVLFMFLILEIHCSSWIGSICMSRFLRISKVMWDLGCLALNENSSSCSSGLEWMWFDESYFCRSCKWFAARVSIRKVKTSVLILINLANQLVRGLLLVFLSVH